MKYQNKKKAFILLADGTLFHGKSVGNQDGTRLVKLVLILV